MSKKRPEKSKRNAGRSVDPSPRLPPRVSVLEPIGAFLEHPERSSDLESFFWKPTTAFTNNYWSIQSILDCNRVGFHQKKKKIKNRSVLKQPAADCLQSQYRLLQSSRSIESMVWFIHCCHLLWIDWLAACGLRNRKKPQFVRSIGYADRLTALPSNWIKIDISTCRFAAGLFPDVGLDRAVCHAAKLLKNSITIQWNDLIINSISW